jgi:hypothetical protein
LFRGQAFHVIDDIFDVPRPHAKAVLRGIAGELPGIRAPARPPGDGRVVPACHRQHTARKASPRPGMMP